MSRGYALFDLDHTLLPHDTQALFCNHVLRREGWRRVYLLWFLPCLPLAAMRLLSLRTMKRVFCSYLVGMKRERLQDLVDEFVAGDFAAALYPEVLAEVERHRGEGRILVLNSASPELYLGAISARLGFDHCLGTAMETPERMPLLPRIEGPNNKHEAKIAAMRERGIVPPEVEVLPDSWAYSDSSADLPLLRLAEHGVMIHPGERLAEAGAAAGWETLKPPRPYGSRWAGRFATLRQAFGCYRRPGAPAPPYQ